MVAVCSVVSKVAGTERRESSGEQIRRGEGGGLTGTVRGGYGEVVLGEDEGPRGRGAAQQIK